MASLLSDAELIQRIRDRDGQAFDEAVARYAGEVRRQLERIVRDRSAADDLFQEVLLRLWSRSEQFTGSGSLGAWLGRIARNLALNHLRGVRRSRRRPLEFVPPAGQADADADDLTDPAWMIDPAARRADELAVRAERHEMLRRLIDRLPPEKREVFRLVREAEMDIDDVADRLGIPAGTVKSRLHYATRDLRSRWADLEDEWENT